MTRKQQLEYALAYESLTFDQAVEILDELQALDEDEGALSDEADARLCNQFDCAL
jgi:hypothetical protein